MAMSAARQAQGIKNTFLKPKTLHSGYHDHGTRASIDGRSCDSRTEWESDGGLDAPSGSAPASCRKGPNP